MDTVAYERSTEEADADERRLLAHEMLSHDVYDLPEDGIVFCPECYEMAETFSRITHQEWCCFGEAMIRPGSF